MSTGLRQKKRFLSVGLDLIPILDHYGGYYYNF